MAVDPARLVLFVPPGLPDFKRDLFERIGKAITTGGGSILRHDYAEVPWIPDGLIPIIGCSPQLRPCVEDWQARGREFIFWDRGYFRRAIGSWCTGLNGGYYRWQRNAFQVPAIRDDLRGDRWDKLNLGRHIKPWIRSGRHIVVADTGQEYWDFFSDRDWLDRTVAVLKLHTDRKIIIRRKHTSVPLDVELQGAHALVTHGSNAAVEAAAMGCPVFVDKCSAAALVGCTDFAQIERPLHCRRGAWFRTLSYSQFNERELVDGTLFRLVW